MATATESSPSPQLRRESRHLASQWSHVVRGEPEAAAASPAATSPPSQAAILPPEPSDHCPPPAAASSDDQPAQGPADAAGVSAAPPSDGTGGGSAAAAAASRGKKPAWNRPLNGVMEAGPVMGAVSWPALSEAARGSPRSSPSDFVKGLPDGFASAAPAPVTVITSSPPRQITKSANLSYPANHGSPTRQKSMKRGGSNSAVGAITSSSAGSAITTNSGSALANGGEVPPSLLQTSPPVPEDSLDKSVSSQPSSRDVNARSSNSWDHGPRGGGGSPRSHGGNEQHRNYGSNRRGHNGGGGGGGAPYHNNFGNRRGLDRGGSDWNNRSFSGGRDLQLQQQQQQQQQQPRAMARPFLRPPPPVSAPFMSPPPPVRPFANPMGYYDITSPIFYVPTHPSSESHGGMPFVSPPAMFYAAPGSQLTATLTKQIDYYFSPENLCKDTYLRQNMDEEGWVPISLIATFNRVKNLTNNIQFILDAVRTSIIVEVQGDKIRRRNDWMNWPPLTLAVSPSHSSKVPSYEALVTHVKNVKLEEQGTSQNSSSMGAAGTEIVLSRSLSEKNSQLQLVIASMGKASVQSTPLASSDQSALGIS